MTSDEGGTVAVWDLFTNTTMSLVYSRNTIFCLACVYSLVWIPSMEVMIGEKYMEWLLATLLAKAMKSWPKTERMVTLERVKGDVLKSQTCSALASRTCSTSSS